MARPLKTGIDYFPLDVDIDEDDKLIDVLEEVGSERGLGAVIYLVKEIYKNEGYYMPWTQRHKRVFCRNRKLDEELMQKVVEVLTGDLMSYEEAQKYEPFFDRKMYREEKILTSKGIQKRFFTACEKRRSRKINKRYILLDHSYGEIPTSGKKINGVWTPILEETAYVTIDKKNIPFEYVVSGEIVDNINSIKDDNNLVNDVKNPVNDDLLVNDVKNPVNAVNNTQRKGKEKGEGKETNNTGSVNNGKKPFEQYHEPTPSEIIDNMIRHWNGKDSLPKTRKLVIKPRRTGEGNIRVG